MLFARLKDVVRTVRFRLMFWTTVIVLILVAVTLFAVRVIVQRTLINDFEQVLQGDFKEVSLEIHQKYPQPSLFQALKQKANVRKELGWFVQIYREDGARIYESEQAPDLGPLPSLANVTEDEPKVVDRDGYRLMIARISTADDAGLVLRMGSSKASVDDDVAQLNRTMLMAGVSILLLAPVGGFLFAGRVMRPLARIISTTARLQPQKLEERLPLRGTGDELDQLSQTINGMLDRIAIYLDRNRDFIANAAHELRSPLAAIRSSVEVALNRPRTNEEYASLLSDVMEECARLSQLVSRLLLLAEGDAGRLSPRDQTTRLDKIVRESIDMFQPVAEAKGLHLEVKALPVAVVRGEDIHLRQVVRNLLDNAIKFTPSPGKVSVSLSVDPRLHRTRLLVSDTGQGIAAEMMPLIFDRFFRGDRARPREGAHGGYGLGLSICQSIIHALNGEIEAASPPGRGTTFTVSLPLVERAV